MNFVVLGTNHRHCPLEIREKIAFNKRELKGALCALLGRQGIKGVVILSTCNRLELYATVTQAQGGIDSLKDFLRGYKYQGLSGKYLYAYTGRAAVRHLFEVACGLDSQIMGEAQVLEQVRFAFQEAKAIEAVDRLSEAVFSCAMATCLKIRSGAGFLGEELSVASLSVEFINHKLGTLLDKVVLVLGTGKVSELLAKGLSSQGAKAAFVSSHNFSRAKALADSIKAEALKFDYLKDRLKEADVLLCAAASPHALLKEGHFSGAKEGLLIIDLGLPRNVAPEVKYITGMRLFNLEDLDFKDSIILKKQASKLAGAQEALEREAGNLCQKEFIGSELEGAGLP